MNTILCSRLQRARTLSSAALVSLILVLIPAVLYAAKQPLPKIEAGAAGQFPLYLRIELQRDLKVSHLKPGNVVEGRLASDVYQGNRELFPAGSRVRLTVDKVARRRRIPNDHWPWVVKFFTPRHENYPTFRSAVIIPSNGAETPLRVSLLYIRFEKSVHIQVGPKGKTVVQPAPGSAGSAGQFQNSSFGMPLPRRTGKDEPQLILALDATAPSGAQPEISTTGEAAASQLSTGPVTLAAGTQARVILLDTLSASKSRPGDAFRARVIEPVRLDSEVALPEGTIIEGKVLKRTPPRMLSRAGTLQLLFSRLIIPGGAEAPVEATIADAELDQRSHTRIDREGGLRGDHPGKAWMLINLGTTAGIAKEADDTTQLIIEAFVSTATDASTAGVARIAGSCASGLFFLTRHGRDVILPKFTEMTIVFDRSVLLASPRQSSGPPAAR
jgi:hypothetical protein